MTNTPGPEPDPDWLTIAEIAKRWRVSKMTVYRTCEAKLLAFTRVGHQFRVHRSAVEAYEQAHSEPAA